MITFSSYGDVLKTLIAMRLFINICDMFFELYIKFTVTVPIASFDELASAFKQHMKINEKINEQRNR
jgi:hypothetical protein